MEMGAAVGGEGYRSLDFEVQKLVLILRIWMFEL